MRLYATGRAGGNHTHFGRKTHQIDVILMPSLGSCWFRRRSPDELYILLGGAESGDADGAVGVLLPTSVMQTLVEVGLSRHASTESGPTCLLPELLASAQAQMISWWRRLEHSALQGGIAVTHALCADPGKPGHYDDYSAALPMAEQKVELSVQETRDTWADDAFALKVRALYDQVESFGLDTSSIAEVLVAITASQSIPGAIPEALLGELCADECAEESVHNDDDSASSRSAALLTAEQELELTVQKTRDAWVDSARALKVRALRDQVESLGLDTSAIEEVLVAITARQSIPDAIPEALLGQLAIRHGAKVPKAKYKQQQSPHRVPQPLPLESPAIEASMVEAMDATNVAGFRAASLSAAPRCPTPACADRASVLAAQIAECVYLEKLHFASTWDDDELTTDDLVPVTIRANSHEGEHMPAGTPVRKSVSLLSWLETTSPTQGSHSPKRSPSEATGVMRIISNTTRKIGFAGII